MSALFKSALAQAELLNRREISAVELMQDTLARIKTINPQVNAIISLREEADLLAQAAQADKSSRTGWMHGLPIAIKDLHDVKGMPSSMGSAIFADYISEKDDIAVARVRAAGAIIIGKTNTPEFGLGSHTYNPVHGTTFNPYDLSKSAGGSSGGAAVALSTRMLPLADGSDMMGSLRNPAAWNNVYGFRPSFGLVPSEPGAEMFLQQNTTQGPMARSPRDLAAFLSVQAGRDKRQPQGLEAQDYLNLMQPDLHGKRLAWLGDWSGQLQIEPELISASDAAVYAFKELGTDVDSLEAPFSLDDIWQSWTILRSWAIACSEAAHYHAPDHRKLLKPEAIWEIERGLSFTGQQLHAASVLRTSWFKKYMKLLETYDAIILPSTQIWPFKANLAHPSHINAQPMDSYHRWMQIVTPASLLGVPVVNLPAGFGAAGLPFGLQLMAARGDDLKLLCMAEAWHRQCDWPSLRPPSL